MTRSPLRDFGSRSGTLVNNESVAGERELNSGDRLKVGNFEFEIQLGAETVEPEAAEMGEAVIVESHGEAPPEYEFDDEW